LLKHSAAFSSTLLMEMLAKSPGFKKWWPKCLELYYCQCLSVTENIHGSFKCLVASQPGPSTSLVLLNAVPCWFLHKLIWQHKEYCLWTTVLPL
jgi:hypothetical protein